MIGIKTKEEVETIAQGGKILAQVLKELVKMVRPGAVTKDLDKAAERLVLSYGANPSFKNYKNFPATICSCVNEGLVHCVPSDRKLKEGDILSIDIGLSYKGYNSDMAVTVPVGRIDFESSRLLRVTKKALKRGIKKVRPGNTFGDIGNTIQRYVEGQGYGIIRDLCGHGIGKSLHEEPDVFNYGKRGTGPEIKEGMVFCIEPMVAIGDWQIKKIQDGFGFATKDGSLSAHFEHTIAVTSKGARILTQ
jgi:methionyl aminopeptidase